MNEEWLFNAKGRFPPYDSPPITWEIKKEIFVKNKSGEYNNIEETNLIVIYFADRNIDAYGNFNKIASVLEQMEKGMEEDESMWITQTDKDIWHNIVKTFKNIRRANLHYDSMYRNGGPYGNEDIIEQEQLQPEE